MNYGEAEHGWAQRTVNPPHMLCWFDSSSLHQWKENMNIDLKGNVIIRHQSIPDCQWCDKAKEYLDEKGLKYSVINADKMFFGSLMKETKSTSVPQIVIKGEFVGDYKGMLQHFLDKEEAEDESA